MLFLTTLLYFIFLILSVSLSASFYFWWMLCFLGMLLFGIIKVVGQRKSLLLLPIVLIAASFFANPFFASKTGIYSFSILSSALLATMLFVRQEIKSKENPDDRRSHPRMRNALSLNKTISISVMMICFLGLFALQENTAIDLWIILAGFFVMPASLFWEIIRLNFKNNREAALISITGGFVSMEFAWALLFWPIGFFSNAVILFAICYAFVDIIDFVLLQKISVSRIAADAVLAIAAILIVAGTSKWLPL